jgi:diaminopimelate decarboxylase
MDGWRVAEHFEAMNGQLHVDGVNVVEGTARFGTPLFIFSEKRLRRNIAEIQQAFQLTRQPSRIFYTSKANSNLAILELVRSTGVDVEVNSGGELFKALEAGFSPSQIVFNGVAKSERELHEAIERGIFCINVDSVFELERLIDIANQLQKRATIALRMVPGITSGSHSGLETGTHTSKFGMEDQALLDCYRKAVEHSDAVNLIGLHMHIGSQTTELYRYQSAFKRLIMIAAWCFDETAHAISHLNIGGGLPVPYVQHQVEGLPSDSFKMLSANLMPSEVIPATIGLLQNEDFRVEVAAVSSRFVNILDSLEIFMEPGRRIIADSAILLTTVHNMKQRQSGDQWLMVDAGFHTLLNAFIYNWYYQLIPASKLDQPASYPYKIGGPLCDSGDEFHDSEHLHRLPDYHHLPEGMRDGDVLALLNVGAYTLDQMTQYNGHPRTGAVLIRENGELVEIRARESYQDLIRQDKRLGVDD